MHEVDGSAGGGQLLRASLTVSALTDTPVRVENVRGNRPTPGLKPQHCTAVETMADICNASVEGAIEGSETVSFDPGKVSGGTYEVNIGTAGSLMLLFEAVVPLAMELDEPLALTAHGGTDVKWSPPVETYRRVTLGLYRELGTIATIDLERTGFYPAGGGAATLYLGPSSPSSLQLTDRGPLQRVRVISKASHDLAGSNVATRQAETAVDGVENVDQCDVVVSQCDTVSAGSSLTVELDYERTRAGFDALGEPGKPAEEIADGVVEQAQSFRSGSAVVDRHTADQLLVVLAVAGGEVRIPERTAHVDSGVSLLQSFGFDIHIDTSGDDPVLRAATGSV